MRRASIILVFVAFLSACRGKPLATAELGSAGGSAQVHFASNGKPIALWSDSDGKWTGHQNLPVHYLVDFVVGGSIVGRAECRSEAASTRVCRSTVTVNGNHSGNCEVKLSCTTPTLPAGDVVVQVTAKPGPEVSELKHLALVVRED